MKDFLSPPCVCLPLPGEAPASRLPEHRSCRNLLIAPVSRGCPVKSGGAVSSILLLTILGKLPFECLPARRRFNSLHLLMEGRKEPRDLVGGPFLTPTPPTERAVCSESCLDKPPREEADAGLQRLGLPTHLTAPSPRCLHLSPGPCQATSLALASLQLPGHCPRQWKQALRAETGVGLPSPTTSGSFLAGADPDFRSPSDL